MVSFTKGYFVSGMPAGYNYVKNAIQNEVSRYKRELADDPIIAEPPVIVSPAIIRALVASVEDKVDKLISAFKTSEYYGIYPKQITPFIPPKQRTAPSTPVKNKPKNTPSAPSSPTRTPAYSFNLKYAIQAVKDNEYDNFYSYFARGATNMSSKSIDIGASGREIMTTLLPGTPVKTTYTMKDIEKVFSELRKKHKPKYSANITNTIQAVKDDDYDDFYSNFARGATNMSSKSIDIGASGREIMTTLLPGTPVKTTYTMKDVEKVFSELRKRYN
jgi:hypothetical protein